MPTNRQYFLAHAKQYYGDKVFLFNSSEWV